MYLLSLKTLLFDWSRECNVIQTSISQKLLVITNSNKKTKQNSFREEILCEWNMHFVYTVLRLVVHLQHDLLVIHVFTCVALKKQRIQTETVSIHHLFRNQVKARFSHNQGAFSVYLKHSSKRSIYVNAQNDLYPHFQMSDTYEMCKVIILLQSYYIYYWYFLVTCLNGHWSITESKRQ